MQIELSESQAETLRQYCYKVQISEAEAVRQALAQFLSSIPKRKLSEHSAFGCWRDKQQDGLDYQYSLRNEWQ